jgi:proteasome lid subunit RPN8/RPN11
VTDIQFEDLTYIDPIEKIIPVADPNCRTEAMGTIAPDDLNIFITQQVLQEVIDYSNSRLDREVGGALVGKLFSHRGVKYIEIEAYIPAYRAVSQTASLVFGHDAWEEINRKKDQSYPDSILVGWHHTHPGYNIFLSSYDMFIHENFFNLPWMVALVVDPKAERLGFFQWKHGQVVQCGFYFVR